MPNNWQHDNRIIHSSENVEAASLRGRQRKAAADKARLRGVELLLLLDERVRVGEVAALRVARELLAPLLNDG